MKSQRLDYNFYVDYDKMQKLCLTSDYSMRHFHQFVSDAFNYLIQPTLQSPRYKGLNEKNDKKDIDYFYELTEPEIDFLKGEPSFFKFVDYLARKTDKTETEQLALNVINSWDIPHYNTYNDLSAASHNCKLEKLDYDISSCYSPVLFDKQSRAWYESLWNAFYIACTGVLLNDVQPYLGWRVSSPVINLKDTQFSELKGLSWTDLASVKFMDYMQKEYDAFDGYTCNPYTRYCQRYDEIMFRDFINRTYYEDIRNWEVEHMSELVYSFWRPISRHYNKNIDDMHPEIKSYFKDDIVKDDMVGGEQTYIVGLDQNDGWNTYNPELLSSCSWISKPEREVDFNADSYYRGQCSFGIYDCNFNYSTETRNPKIKPPLKPVAENIYALAYVWTKFLSHDDGESIKYISHATAQQQIPYYHTTRDQRIIVNWGVEFDLSSGNFEFDEEGNAIIGKATCTQYVISNDSGWLSSDSPDTNSFTYSRDAGYGHDGASPTIQDFLCYDYGDLRGKCYFDEANHVYHCSVDMTDETEKEYAEQMKLLFPKSREQQRRDELDALSNEYVPQIDDLSVQIEELSDQAASLCAEIDSLSSLSAQLVDMCERDAYAYGWDHTYNTDYDISKLSDFFTYCKTIPPYLNFVRGEFFDIQDYDFKSKLVAEISDYIASQPMLSACPEIHSLEDLENAYYGYFLNNPQVSSYIQAIESICQNETTAQIADTVGQFKSSLPSTAYKTDIEWFKLRLSEANDNVYSAWHAHYEHFVGTHIEQYMEEYNNRFVYFATQLSDVEQKIRTLQYELEMLLQEYEQKKKEIEEKTYDVPIPSLADIPLLYNIKRNPNAIIIEGTGFNTTYRNAKVKMDVRDGIPDQVENYDGLSYRYPLSYSNDKNQAIDRNAYLMFASYHKETYNGRGTVTEDKIKPYVDDTSKDYDTFRQTTIPQITQDMKSMISYNTKEGWFGAEYHAGELDDYNMKYETEITCNIGDYIDFAVHDTGMEVEVDFNGQKWMAAVLHVNEKSNFELGVGTHHMYSYTSWKVRDKFQDTVPSKIYTNSVSITASYPSQILCQTEWRCY